ncbi:hypothetical protein G7Y29_04935 [Corynebacterium qintianiae]|uniref:Lipoprotein n=1 Tax=Corynebacterium qintianiae TaxID=2709392 RepID=A0A7T0KPJ6_9CORY|nr:hypothetical protein [Corynebacterium qintianiae]QPK84114.1 hypothetical protein G7Y29_04935 [Corynebacterium qintianiae]
MRKSLSAISAFSVLALAGCGAQGEAGPQTVTMTTIAYVDPETPEEQASAGPGERPETAEKQTSIPASQVGGDCGTMENGITVTAYTATSCEFARAIYPVATSATYAPVTKDPTVTALDSVRGLQVASPVTGETYTIDCFKSSAGDTLRCHEPGNEKTVGADYSGPGPAYWHSVQSPI